MSHHITEKRNLGGISGHKYKNTNGPKNKLFFLRETCSHNPSRFNLSSAKFDRWRASFNLSFSDRQFMQ